MKKLIIFSMFLLACHPSFKKDWARDRLELLEYEDIRLGDYIEYPNCSNAHTYATSWQAIDRYGYDSEGIICCSQFNQCMVFEKK